VLAENPPSIDGGRVEYDDVSISEDSQNPINGRAAEVACRSGDDELGFGVASSKLLDHCIKAPDIDVGTEYTIGTSITEPLQLKQRQPDQVAAASVAEHRQRHGKR
jgi:hypothetical protein